MIIDDVDSKLPFLSGIFEAGWSWFLNLSLVLNVAGENMPVFFF